MCVTLSASTSHPILGHPPDSLFTLWITWRSRPELQPLQACGINSERTVKCDTMSTVPPWALPPNKKKIIHSKSIFKNPYDIKTQLRKKNANVTNTESFWRSNLIKIGDRNEKTENYKLAAYARSFLFASSNIINHQHTKESEKLVIGCGCMCRNNKEMTISTAVCYF